MFQTFFQADKSDNQFFSVCVSRNQEHVAAKMTCVFTMDMRAALAINDDGRCWLKVLG